MAAATRPGSEVRTPPSPEHHPSPQDCLEDEEVHAPPLTSVEEEEIHTPPLTSGLCLEVEEVHTPPLTSGLSGGRGGAGRTSEKAFTLTIICLPNVFLQRPAWLLLLCAGPEERDMRR